MQLLSNIKPMLYHGALKWEQVEAGKSVLWFNCGNNDSMESEFPTLAVFQR